MSDQELSDKIAEEYGYSDGVEMAEDYIMDSVVPGICSNCFSFVDRLEPDARKCKCHKCESKDTVESLMSLLGLA